MTLLEANPENQYQTNFVFNTLNKKVLIRLLPYVAIERCIRLLSATVVGMFYAWFTVGELRSPGNRVAQ